MVTGMTTPETWQVVIEHTSDLLVEVEADSEDVARWMALRSAGDYPMERWGNEELRTVNAWRKSEHDATADEQ